jgi:hypothetical protein
MAVPAMRTLFVGESWTPLSVAGCVGWWDASNLDSITESAGAVSQIDDLSGNGNHAEHDTAANQPTTGTRTVNSRNVLDCDGTSDMLRLPDLMSGATAGTAFVVAQVEQDPPASGLGKTGSPFADFGRDANSDHFPWSDSIIYHDFGSSARKTAGDPSGSMATNPRLVSIVSASSDWRMYVDGTLLHSTGTNTVAWGANPRLFSNGSYFLWGRWCEAFVYTSALSDTNREAAQAYLKAKWGTP